MKQLFSIIALSLLTATTTVAQQAPLSLSGTVVGDRQPAKVYLHKFIDRYYQLVDSADVTDGRFSFSTQVVLPEVYGLSTTQQGNPYLLFLDKGDINVTLSAAPGNRGTHVSGSPLHDLYLSYRADPSADIDTFISQHPSSLVAVYLLYRDHSYRMSNDEIRRHLALLDPALLSTPYARILQELTTTLEAVSVGKPAPDFTIHDIEGKPVKLSDYTGKGYLLLDFWASWCQPCRRENPNIVKAYEQFHDRGFDILGVSLDRTREAWLKAIEQDTLPWHHVSELKYWDSEPARIYGIRSIPNNVLIAPDGNIVARKLRGDDLINTLNELLK